MPGFELAWNIVCGIPFLIPSFFYSNHKSHHAAPSFGTARDNEYFGPHMRGWRGLAVVFLAALILPLGNAIRFMVLTPIACTNGRMRDWLDRRASTLAFIGMTDRDPPKPFERRQRRIYELSCTAFIWVAAGLISIGLIKPTGPLVLYLIAFAMLLLNGARLLVANRYDADDHAVSRTEQFLDSFNYSRRRYLTWMWAPLGLQLHALHHLFPGIPYHNLAEAHRRLSSALPSDSIYHLVEGRGFWTELRAFLMPSPAGEAARGRMLVDG
jgi:fatty acid desaturase